MADIELDNLIIRDFKTSAGFQAAVESGEIGENDLNFTPFMPASIPLLTPIWLDHEANDMSWLRADTFSWHSGDVYKAAYEHLVNDLHLAYANPADPEKVDVIGDIPITYVLTPDGHKICSPDQESNMVALYEATGVAWYYILDDENKQFKLPRTKYGFTGLRDSVGGYVAPGLPNIKDSTQIIGSGGCGFYGETTGALYASGSATSQFGSFSGGDTRTHINIDASRSNAIYGASDTVQPAATQMYLYFYVGHFEQDATEQTAGLNAEMFNEKADRNLLNTTNNVDIVVESQLPAADNGYTWYRKYKSGWVEQGGRWTGSVSFSAAAVVNTPVTLPVQMASASYQAFAQATAQVGLLAITNPANQTNTATTLNVTVKETLNATRTMTEFIWQVSGMSAQ